MPEIKPKDIPLHIHQWKRVEYMVDNHVYQGGWVCSICGSMTILEDRQYYV